MSFLIAIIVLWGSTLGIIALDKSRRANAPRPTDEAPSFAEEPGWGVLAALCIVLNIAALPYYFYATRRSAAWGFIGFGGCLACFFVTVVVLVIAQMAGVR